MEFKENMKMTLDRCVFNAIVSSFTVSLVLFSSAMAGEEYSPYIEQNHPTNVYWGDTHLHTSLSIDAYLLNGTRIGPEEAYRFARGGMLERDGMKIRLSRPLDFLAIADHDIAMGVVQALDAENPLLQETEFGRSIAKRYKAARDPANAGKLDIWDVITDLLAIDFENDAFKRSIWKRTIDAAETNNVPGKFTAFIAYEWSPKGKGEYGASVYTLHHRNVIFKDGAAKTSQVIPFTLYDSEDPEDLWQYLDSYRRDTGGDVLAIPHNGNLSDGRLFAANRFDGSPIDSNYAEIRSSWEPIVEVTQVKGDSETHPILSPTDEFADFETWTNTWGRRDASGYTGGYARSGLKSGLEQFAALGVNPFKFGMIGSSDSHSGLPAIREDNFFGSIPTPPRANALRPEPDVPDTLEERRSKFIKGLRADSGLNASGYAAVWAVENTREALFDAMKRREVYATTGTRISVRFFGGWSFGDEDAFSPDLARIGYAGGVPMGGDLTHAPAGAAPSFLIRAVKDSIGANLDRVQIIKGWVDERGESQEKVYNVALSDGRKVKRNGKVKPVGNTVDVSDATYSNTIGDPELAVMWVDPDFDRNQVAFYYVRVLEIPTPRWSAYDVKFFGKEHMNSPDMAMVTQERAYTSPIWYTP